VSSPADQPLIVSRRIQIPAEELNFTYVRSSGPGGQNVNQVNTKAVLRWSLSEHSSLSDPIKERFAAKYGNRLTADGELVLTSQFYRYKSRNVVDCFEKLRAMLAVVASPPNKRWPTKPSKGAIKRRLERKQRQSQKKPRRGARPNRDDG
jgi:ribosome-associated protein